MGPPAATNGGLKSWTPESGSSRTDKHCWQMHGNCRELAINSQKILLEVQEPNQATNYSQVFHCWHLLSSFRTEDAVNSLNLMGKIKHMDMRSFSALVVIGISHLPLCHLPRVLGGPRAITFMFVSHRMTLSAFWAYVDDHIQRVEHRGPRLGILVHRTMQSPQKREGSLDVRGSYAVDPWEGHVRHAPETLSDRSYCLIACPRGFKLLSNTTHKLASSSRVTYGTGLAPFCFSSVARPFNSLSAGGPKNEYRHEGRWVVGGCCWHVKARSSTIGFGCQQLLGLP